MDEKSRESILSGIFKYSISTWMNLFIGFVSIVITTRIVSPENYGYISIFSSATSVLMYIFTLGLDGAYIRFFNEPPKGNSKNQLLYKNIIVVTFISVVFVFLVFFFISDTFSNYIFGFSSKVVIGILFVHTYCQAVLRLLNINFRMGFKFKQYNIQNILVNCSTRVLIIIAAFFWDNFILIITVETVGIAILLLIYLIIQREELIPITENGSIDYKFNWHGFSEYFRFAIFSAPTYIINYLNVFLGQQIIRAGLSAYSLGVFSSTGMFSTILSALKGGFSTYWTAYVYKNYTREQKNICAVHDYVMIFALFIASGFVMLRDVIYLIIGNEYHDSKSFFSLLLIMPILSFVMETTDKGIALKKKNEIVFFNYTISAGSNVLFCVLLIPILGLHGAAIANAIAGVILFLLNTICGQKYYKSIINRKKSVVGVIAIILVLTIPAITKTLPIIIFSTLTIDAIVVVIYNKEVIIAVKKVIKFLHKSTRSSK